MRMYANINRASRRSHLRIITSRAGAVRPICAALVLLIVVSAGAQPAPPEAAVVLSPHVFWRSTRWPGEGWTRSAAVGDLTDIPRFTVAEPDRRHAWTYRLAASVDRRTYPVLSVTYRAHGFPPDPVGFLLWLDDGRGPAYSDWTPISAADIVDDGEAHTLRRDLRDHSQGEWIKAVGIAIRSGDQTPAWLELVDLRFEADSPGTAPEVGESVSVRVLDDDGETVAGATVTIDAERANWVRTQHTKEDGAVTLSPLVTASGQHMLRVAKSGHVTVEVTGIMAADGPFHVVLPRGTMYGGQVVDAAGQPLPGVAVEVQVRHESVRSWRPMPTLFTDAQGRWRTPVLSEKGIGLELRFSHPDVQDPMYMRQLSAAQLAEGEFRIELAGTELDVHRAAQLGMLEWLRAALSRDPSLVSRQKERLTLLQTAAQFDRPDIIDVLVDHGADLTDMGPGSTPLHRAVEFGSLAAARRLWSAAPIPTSATALTRRPCTTRSGRTRTGCVQPRSSWRPSTSSSNLAPTWTPATAAWGPHWIML